MERSAHEELKMNVAAARAETDFTAARKAMIESQLRVSGVNEPSVLAAVAEVTRESHVPPAATAFAYIDRAVALDSGRFLAAPLFYGRLLSEAQIARDDKVLVVDAGSGYLSALANALADNVETIGVDEAVAQNRKKGGFTVLLVDGAIEQLPASLAARLEDGARIVTGLVTRGVTRLAFGRKVGGEVALLPLAEMGIPILGDFAIPKGWSF
jgi:protein-L-isoaspartate(D-aspartate) O-methyltransferase